ncbi:hypothetical protein ABB22_15260 [Stenotrophomonas nitritireducens]|uniref:Secreted protein n=1 Tax=Stenotrophomonas nitritireducens TaxID=83617 RepID=A0ABR5NGN8_9GAMM|nr:hypothetical protein ABB22_15260 [Stenotrophomonas nitritireducens]
MPAATRPCTGWWPAWRRWRSVWCCSSGETAPPQERPQPGALPARSTGTVRPYLSRSSASTSSGASGALST